MKKSEFLDTLQWVEGQPPPNYDTGENTGNAFSEKYGPIVCKTKKGKVFVVGDCNFLGGVCDCCREYHRDDVTRYAFLWGKP
jgi:hypothetical protein